ncbi:MAGa7180 family putative nuclease [Mycoplasmopsis columbinasalis]|uniref:YqaJ viral recombinase domain-containing protein n=1 Tax=Mycoplasmopsis columbinasalis TaxID=114880 RepID=A0A449BAI8_9BACT|nr:hypothetical protein [Mycoplasmopsis columbinasalis]VEU78221.1 Uncharacterised protein [Mycoplasmopsis columbinasalis]
MSSILKRFYNGKDYVLDEEAQEVRLLPDFHKELLESPNKFKKFKKFGGSSIGDVFETDAFKSQFNAFCFISRLKMPALQMKYINAGVALEPKVVTFMQKIFPGATIEHIRAEDVEYDYFKNDEIIGGVPDALVPTHKTVLELKAVGAKKRATWVGGVIPEDYKKQAQLYAYLLGYPYYSIVGTFLEETDYTNYDQVNFLKQTQMFNFKVNEAMAQDDIKVVKDFWKKYTNLGRSPKYQLPRDKDQVDYLRCRNEAEWEILFNSWKEKGKVDENIEFR